MKNAVPGTVATVDDLKKLGFIIKGTDTAGKPVSGQVKHADTVEFAGEDLAKVITESKDGVSKVTVKVSKEEIAKAVNAENAKKGSEPTTYVDKDGNPLVKDGDKYYKPKADGTPDKDAGEKTPAGVRLGEKDKPMQLTNVARGTESKPVKGEDGNPIMGTGSKPVQLADLKDAKDTKVATVGDLKDMGFILGASVNAASGANAYQDVVKNGNKVKFVGYGGAWISGKTADDGTRIITIDVNADNLVTGTQNAIQYVDGQGNRMIPMLQKGKEVLYYNAADNPVKHKTPTGEDAVYKASDIIDEAGTLKDGATPLEGKKAGDVPNLGVALVDPNGSANTQKGTVLRNVGEGTATIAAPTDDKDIVGKAKAGLADLANSKDTNGLSVADAKKLGFVIKGTDENGKAVSGQVRHANTVEFAGDGLAKVITESKDGVSKVTVKVSKEDIAKAVNAENAKKGSAPTTYVDENGNPLVKGDDGKYYKPNPDGTPNKAAGEQKPAGVQIGEKDKPITVTNVKSNFAEVAPDAKEAKAPESKKNPDGSVDPTAANPLVAMQHNAATIADIMNSPWNLQVNGKAVKAVKSFDTVNITDGTNTKVVATETGYKVNVVGLPTAYTDNAGNTIAKGTDGKWFVTDKDGNMTATPADFGQDGKGTPSVSLVNPAAEPGKAGKPVVMHNVGQGNLPTDAVNKEQMDEAFAKLGNSVAGVQSEMRNVGADAAALAALKPLQYDPLEPTQVMAAIGGYRGGNSVALGVAHYTNESTMLHAGITFGGNRMFNIGLTKKFGHSDEERMIPQRYRSGPISSVYVMQDEVSKLKAENEQQKQEIKELREMVMALMGEKKK